MPMKARNVDTDEPRDRQDHRVQQVQAVQWYHENQHDLEERFHRHVMPMKARNVNDFPVAPVSAAEVAYNMHSAQPQSNPYWWKSGSLGNFAVDSG